MIFCTLNLYMKKNKLTQTQITEETKIARPTLLALIKNTNQNIKYETIDELCRFLGISMSELLIYSKNQIEYLNTTLERDDELLMQTDGDIERIIITSKFKINNNEIVFTGNYVRSPFVLELTSPKPITLSAVFTNEPSRIFNQSDFNYIFEKYIEVFRIKEKIASKLHAESLGDPSTKLDIDKLKELLVFNFELTSGGKINSLYESINQLNELEFQELMKKINYKNSKSKEDEEYEVALANSFKNIMRQKNKSHQE